jgi:hypothetical protein
LLAIVPKDSVFLKALLPAGKTEHTLAMANWRRGSKFRFDARSYATPALNAQDSLRVAYDSITLEADSPAVFHMLKTKALIKWHFCPHMYSTGYEEFRNPTKLSNLGNRH